MILRKMQMVTRSPVVSIELMKGEIGPAMA